MFKLFILYVLLEKNKWMNVMLTCKLFNMGCVEKTQLVYLNKLNWI